MRSVMLLLLAIAMLLLLVVAMPASADKYALPVRQESFIMHSKGPQGGGPVPIPSAAYVDVRDLPALARSMSRGIPVSLGQACSQRMCVTVDDRPARLDEKIRGKGDQ